jgi:hypothetical protein
MHKLHQGCVDENVNVKNHVGLLLAAVLMQARIDCDIVNSDRDYYGRPGKRKPNEEMLLSYDSLAWFINEPGIIEAFASWQDEIQPEAIREDLRRALG